jgi:hypothetical protein
MDTVCRYLDGGKGWSQGMYLPCRAAKKKSYLLQTDISSVQPVDVKHALDLVAKVNGPLLLNKDLYRNLWFI